jgi:hypothetical protein
MKTTRNRWALGAVLLGLATVLPGCGGGGGGGGGGGDGAGGSPPPAAGQVGTVRWLQDSVFVERDVFATESAPSAVASLSVQAPNVAYWYRYRFDANVVSIGVADRSADDGLDFRITFFNAFRQRRATYNDTLSVDLCLDSLCNRPVAGSPFTIPLRMDVGYYAQPEPDLPVLAPAQTSALQHDVVGAAYSATLDAVVTVSARPVPALRVHDLRTGTTRQIALLTAPTSVVLSADGRQATVGHDAAISRVDLGADSAAAVRRWPVPDMVLAVLPTGPSQAVAVGGMPNAGWNSIYFVDTDTGAIGKAGGFGGSYGNNVPVLHPSGNRIYTADRDISPSDVRVLDLRVPVTEARFVDSRYHGEYEICAPVQSSRDGSKLYTGCGVVMGSAARLADDMVYAGRMVMSVGRGAFPRSFSAASISVAPDDRSVSMIEQDAVECRPPVAGFPSDCNTRLAVYDTLTLARQSLHAMGVHQRERDRLRQWGRHLVHRADGSRVLVTEVRTQDEDVPLWLMHRLP